MGALGKLAGLKRAWIVYGVFIALVGLVRDGFDSQSLVDAALRIGGTSAFAWYLTKQLAEKSSLMWAVGVVFGLLGAIIAGMEIIGTLADAVEGLGFSFARCVLAVASAYIHVRTFRVLRDVDVKRHVMLD